MYIGQNILHRYAMFFDKEYFDDLLPHSSIAKSHRHPDCYQIYKTEYLFNNDFTHIGPIQV